MQLFKAANVDGSGDLSYTEFIASVLSKDIYLNPAYLQQVFNMFDQDKDGSIDKFECS